MKKSLILFSVAALALVSCAKVTDQYVGAPESHEIGFSLLSQPATRAADTYQYAIPSTTFPTDLNMYVAAYEVEPDAGNYFAGTQFIYGYQGGTVASGTVWGGATARYWPLSAAYINFLAYANVTGSASFATAVAPATPDYASSAVITQTDNSSAQTDLIYAIGNGAVTQSGNTLTFPTQVDMQFKHAQAWIDFTVKGTGAAISNITVNYIKLNGANYSGTYTITHTNYDKKTGQSVAGVWSSPGDNKDVTVPTVPAATTYTLTAVAQTVGKGLMIVPGTDAFTSFTVNYTYDNHTYNYTYIPASTTVAQAKHYTYNLTFQLHEIYVDATVANWDTTSASTDVTIQ